MYLLCIFFPGLALIAMGKLVKGLICILLQVTLIGWIPAAIWASANYAEKKADKRANKIARAVGQQQNININSNTINNK